MEIYRTRTTADRLIFLRPRRWLFAKTNDRAARHRIVSRGARNGEVVLRIPGSFPLHPWDEISSHGGLDVSCSRRGLRPGSIADANDGSTFAEIYRRRLTQRAWKHHVK